MLYLFHDSSMHTKISRSLYITKKYTRVTFYKTLAGIKNLRLEPSISTFSTGKESILSAGVKIAVSRHKVNLVLEFKRQCLSVFICGSN